MFFVCSFWFILIYVLVINGYFLKLRAHDIDLMIEFCIILL